MHSLNAKFVDFKAVFIFAPTMVTIDDLRTWCVLLGNTSLLTGLSTKNKNTLLFINNE